MKTLSRLIPAVLLLASVGPAARGQALVVSSKSADDLIASARAGVVAAMGEAGQAQQILQFLDLMKGPDLLKGLDRTKPMGVYSVMAPNPGTMPTYVALIPVTSPKDFLDLLGRFNIPTEEVKGTQGVTHTITAPGLPMPLFGRFEGGYAAFATVPAGPPSTATLKPAAVFAGTNVPLMAKLAFDQIPPAVKQAAAAAIDQNAALLKAKREGETEENYNGRLAVMKLGLENIMSLLNEGKDLTLALNVDPKKGDLSVDLTAKALPKTSMASSFQAFGSKASLFRSMGGTTGSAFARLPIAESLRKPFLAGVAKGREDVAKTQENPADVALKNEFLDLIQPLLTGPELDLGAAMFGPFPVEGGKSTYAGLFALKVVDGNRVDKFLREQAVKAAKEKPAGIEKVTLDVAKSADGKSAIHEVVLNGPAATALGRFGEPVIRISTRPDAVLFAVGNQGLEPLKKAITSLATAATPAPGTPQIEAKASINSIVPLLADDPKAEAALRAQMKGAGIFQGADAKRDSGMLRVTGTGDSMAIQLKLDGPTIKFLISIGQTMR